MTAPEGWQDRFRSRLRELGITQERLANDLGVTQGLISQYSRGESQPSLHLFAQICRLLGVTMDWMMFGDGARPGPMDARANAILEGWRQLNEYQRKDIESAVRVLAAANGRLPA